METGIRFYRSVHRNGHARLARLAVVVMLLALGAVSTTIAVYGSTTITKRYVSPTGADTNNNCLTSSNPCKTIGHALLVAAAGDEIRAAAGSYLENLNITKNVIIEGATLGNTYIDGGGTGRVVSISPGVTATLSELTIQNGKVTTAQGAGISNAGTLTLKRVIITANTSTSSPASNDNGGGIWNTGTLTVESSYVSLNNADNNGGGIYNQSGTLTVQNSVISGNTAGGYGGGIENQATAMLTHTGIANNEAGFGGGLDNSTPGAVTLSNVTISGNTSNQKFGVGGGMVQSSTNHATLTNVTFSRNVAHAVGGSTLGGGLYNASNATSLTDVTFESNFADVGGGMENNSGVVTATNVTFSDNGAGWGGGLFNYTRATTALTNVTFSGSITHGGIGVGIFNDGTVTLKNTIIANSPVGGNCYNNGGTFVDKGHNLDSGNTCGFSAANGDLINTDPLLGPLQNNGGYTDTLALFKGSPAINHGTNVGCPQKDQRGKTRITSTDPTCDIGAYEYP